MGKKKEKEALPLLSVFTNGHVQLGMYHKALQDSTLMFLEAETELDVGSSTLQDLHCVQNHLKSWRKQSFNLQNHIKL